MSAAVAHTLSSLPPPGGSTQEVLLRRMLLQCSQRMQAQGQAAQQQQADWRSDAKFHVVLDALQERLYDLEQGPADARPPPDVLQAYHAAVRGIASELRPLQLPAYCVRGGDGGGSGGATSTSGQQQQHGGGNKQANGSIPARQQQQTQQQPKATGAGSGGGAQQGAPGGGPGSSGGTTASPPNFSLSGRAQEQLRTQQRLQDELTDDLLDMGAELKSSTLAMHNAIRFRGKLLEDTETHLVHSAENAKAVAAKAKEQYRQGSWNLCHTCLILISVALIFSAMIVAIRVSAFVGIKGT